VSVPDLLDETLARARRVETTAGGCRVVWRAWGEGDPIVLTHGGHGSWSHWVRNVGALSARRTVWAPDLPGYGDSDSLAEPGDAAAIARVLSAGADELFGADAPLDLMGFSFGGVVAGFLAALRPAQVRRLILVGSAGLGIARFDGRTMRPWRHLTDEAELHAALAQNLQVLMLHDPASVDALALRLHRENSERTRFRSKDISRSRSLVDVLAALPARLYGIWGGEDVTALPDVRGRGEQLRLAQAHARFEVIEGAGHWVQYERADAFDALVAGFLADGGQSAAAGR
jgi:pimeloyl-ACP methyl ester carboxylesterase